MLFGWLTLPIIIIHAMQMLNAIIIIICQAYASEVCRKEYQALGMSIVRIFSPFLSYLLLGFYLYQTVAV